MKNLILCMKFIVHGTKNRLDSNSYINFGVKMLNIHLLRNKYL